MGGALELASEPGRGSTFTFRLPASSVPSDASVSAREAENGLEFLGATGEKVLIVEDEEDIARFAEEVFARRGYKVLRASRGLEALETLRANEEGLALVLLDLVLPELSASTLYRALAAGAPHIPILFMTGREDLAAEVDPAIPLLRKPFSESELLECARRAVLGGV
jgi:DNA-binding NtrC family response regulator